LIERWRVQDTFGPKSGFNKVAEEFTGEMGSVP
jgi:hypothetical protein